MLNSNKTLAIVGSRACSYYGRKVTRLFSNEISNKGVCVVSGMASGIDSEAHDKAIENIGKTIAVLGNGLNYIYPPENEWLFNKILANDGCIITEHEKNKKPDLSIFPKRNRIISGLSDAILVVEAEHRSGSSVTVRYGKEYGKPIYAVPSNIDSITGVGTNNMIMDGAYLVTKPKHILEKMDIFNYKTIDVPEEYAKIYSLLENPKGINEIAKLLKISVQDVNSTITMMELEGYITKNSQNEYKRGDT